MIAKFNFSSALALVLWLAWDIALFRFSRSGLFHYTSVVVGLPVALAAVLTLIWRLEPCLSFGGWQIFRLLLWSKLMLFHWYVIPIVYRFNQRDDWMLEIGHHVLALVVQFPMTLLALRGFKNFRQRGIKSSR